MHDIDRALFEQVGETYGQEGPYETYTEAVPYETYAGEGGSGEIFAQEGPSYETYAQEISGEIFGEEVGPLEAALRDETGTMNETALASQMLELTSDHEVDRFLGDLVNSAVSAATNFAKSDVGRAVGGVLKSAAKKVLPRIGQAVGDYLAPGVGGRLGQAAGQWVGNKLELGLSLEGLSPEDRQFETARAFVRFAGDTARLAAQTPRSVSPAVAAQRAAITAAQRNMPGLLAVPAARHRRAHSGRWVRRGKNIIIIDA